MDKKEKEFFELDPLVLQFPDDALAKMKNILDEQPNPSERLKEAIERRRRVSDGNI